MSSNNKTTTTKPTLYQLLHVESTCTTTELRKSFLALARIVHPDKNPHDPNAAKNFQALRRAYEILNNPTTRERYDRTGISPDDEGVGFDTAYEKYRGIKVTEKDIELAEQSYRESQEEKDDLITYFESHHGDVTNVLGFIIASRNEDRERFIEFWSQALKDGRCNKKFKKTFDTTKKNILSLEELDAQEEDIDDDEEEEDEDVEMDEEDDGFIVHDDEEINDDDSDEEDNNNNVQLTIGDSVLAKWKGGNRWYNGKITKKSRDGKKFSVQYDQDGVVEDNIPRNYIKTSSSKSNNNKKRTNSSSATATTTTTTTTTTTSEPIHDDEIDDMDGLIQALRKKAANREAEFDKFESKYRKKSKRI
jgi:DnaJ family protein C protein 9